MSHDPPIRCWLAYCPCVVLCVIVCEVGCGDSQQPTPSDLTAKEFVERFCSKLRENDPSVSTEIAGELEVKASWPNEDPTTVFLDNTYREYQRAPETLEAVIENLVRMVVLTGRPGDDRPIDRKRVVPVVKTIEFLESMNPPESSRDGKKVVHHEKLNDELAILYGSDWENSVAFLTADDIAGLGVPNDLLRAFAVDNLVNLLPDIQRQSDKGVHLISAGSMYETSLLLYDDFWKPENISVDGDYVVAVPCRGSLLVTGSNDAPGVEQIRRQAKSIYTTAGYAITDSLFIRDNGKWLPFEAD